MNTRSFVSMFELDGIAMIEIPIIQRDYAQGRQYADVPRIRKAFLETLHRALNGGEPASLDFVYGDVADGKMIPLDGQQRLTTLFLLHWYLAARAGIQDGNSNVVRHFTYETRYSSRDFCAKLAVQRPPFPLESLSDWIRDQTWFFGAWRHDPTIQSMLVVLEDIHDLFRDCDCVSAWQRLVDRENPAILFHVLPIKGMGLTDDLYIKMNSRGKPLTRFEHFKANFEKTIRSTSPDHYKELIRKIDNDWADLLLPLRGDDNLIDDEFMRYFRFITDVLVYRSSMQVSPDALDKDIDGGAGLVYGKDNRDWMANQRFLFNALDRWDRTEISAFFDTTFTKQGWKPNAVAIFDTVNLFESCCKDYGKMEGRNRSFTLQRMLLLFAVLIHRISGSEDFPGRMRTVRNLVLGSDSEIRVENLPLLLASTSAIIEKGDIASTEGYNRKQVEEEQRKGAFLSAHPELEEALFRLEDHTLMQGCIAVFDLDATHFVQRVQTFHDVFTEDDSMPLMEVSAALLACGDYSQHRRGNRYQFGSRRRKDVWHQLLTGTASTDFACTGAALMQMLDALGATAAIPVKERLRRIAADYVAVQENARRFDWRYYLVKYDEMREGDSGLYVGPDDGLKGFDLCMMYKERMTSNYRDPFLYAVFRRSGAVADEDIKDPWHTGYQTAERWMTICKSGVQLRCRREGFVLKEPSEASYRDAFSKVMAKHGVNTSLTLLIPQVFIDGVPYDTQDRVQMGAALVRDLLAMPALNGHE